ncbi:MAG: oxidoreductase family protein [Myxococcota bacterium]|nr:oxidoreductase family protein [Myxococcota bacterium]
MGNTLLVDSGELDSILDRVASILEVPEVQFVEQIQSLWSGYGLLFRAHVGEANIVVKWISPTSEIHHPRGFVGDFAHQRKLRSYEVERYFYADHSGALQSTCPLPEYLGSRSWGDASILVLSDLQDVGFAANRGGISRSGIHACLQWLAAFHSHFLGRTVPRVWDTGTYWHLETRPEELAVTREPRLKDSAFELDHVLKSSQFQTLVHGDAKLANFCFTSDQSAVAAVDFQYVGGGVGIKDVAYLLSSCLLEDELVEQEAALLECYFKYLDRYLTSRGISSAPVIREWRWLYPIAWADFARFLSGWAPGHWKLNEYAEHQVDKALARLSQ